MSKFVNEEEVSELLEDIKHCYPELEIKRENIINPSTDFVIRFLEAFLADVDEKINEMLYSDSDIHKWKKSVDQNDYELALFLRARNVFDLDCDIFTLADFYLPSYKRIVVLLKTSLNFVLYLQQATDKTRDRFADQLELLQEAEVLERKKEESKMKIEVKVENILAAEERLKEVEEECRAADDEYKKMKEENRKKLALERELEAELQKCSSILEHNRDTVEGLKRRNNILMKSVVNQKEFEILKMNAESLRSECESLKSDDADYEKITESKKNDLKHFTDIYNTVKAIDLEPLTVIKGVVSKQMEIADLNLNFEMQNCEIQSYESKLLKIKQDFNTFEKNKQSELIKEKALAIQAVNDLKEKMHQLEQAKATNTTLKKTIGNTQRTVDEYAKKHLEYGAKKNYVLNSFGDTYEALLATQNKVTTEANASFGRICDFIEKYAKESNVDGIKIEKPETTIIHKLP